MMHLPCREDRANAAISWMVRALLDFGNISMVSSTFTWNDKRKKKECDSGENWCSSTAQHECEPAPEYIVTHRITQCCLFMERGLLCSQHFNNFSVLQGLGKWGVFSYAPINAFNESQAVCQQPNVNVHARSWAYWFVLNNYYKAAAHKWDCVYVGIMKTKSLSYHWLTCLILSV